MWNQIRAINGLFWATLFHSPRRLWRQHLCFHHEMKSGHSYIQSALVDLGRTKKFWCSRCQKVWMLDELIRDA